MLEHRKARAGSLTPSNFEGGDSESEKKMK